MRIVAPIFLFPLALRKGLSYFIPFVGSFDPYWVVWFHAGVATYYINKWMQAHWSICTKYNINELFINRSIQLMSIKKLVWRKTLNICLDKTWSKLGQNHCAPPPPPKGLYKINFKKIVPPHPSLLDTARQRAMPLSKTRGWSPLLLRILWSKADSHMWLWSLHWSIHFN